MRLELATFEVRDIQFADRTAYADGILSVDRAALREAMLSSGDFADVQLAIVRPGDETRVIHVLDVAEPRWKPDGHSAFSGFVGERTSAGDGRTHRLGGMAVVSTSDAVAGEALYWREALIDMAGPGARATPFSETVNLVVQFQPKPMYQDANHPDAKSMDNSMIGSPLLHRYSRRLREALLRAASYLAEATAGLTPDRVETFELTPAPKLPRVVYIYQFSSLSVHGERADTRPPEMMHPNEILDGAIVSVAANSHASHRYSTYLNQNHGVIRELYARHGRELDFAGVITYPSTMNDLRSKEAVAETVVEMARSVGADAAISNYAGGGHPCVEFMLICQKAEQVGIKTVLVMPEAYGTPDDPGFVHHVPEATAIVSTGRHTQTVQLPAMRQVIGGDAFFDLPDAPGGALEIPLRYLYGGSSSTGSGRLTARQY